MPMSPDFERRLYPIIPQLVETFGTPFHVYDEVGIRRTGERLKKAFARAPSGFREFFAVKALPNPAIMRCLIHDLDFGFDCSSIPELILAREIGASAGDIMFTSNNTSAGEFVEAASSARCILNLDDITLIDKVPNFPEMACFRYNPGARRTGNSIIGKPEEAKYGVTHDQVVEAYRLAQKRGAKRFGLHTMVCSNELNYQYMVETVRMLLNLVVMIGDELGIRFEFINMGGGLGTPYRPEDPELPLEQMATEIIAELQGFNSMHGYVPALCMESGRYVTGPHGALVTQVITQKHTYREYRGVDSCMTALMRPGMYGAYHHITVPFGAGRPLETVDVVGSICENCDKFAIQRKLPKISEGDIIVIHNTGAHGLAMGFNYNGRLRPQELFLRSDGSVELIRRAEMVADLFATLRFTSKRWKP